MQCLYGGGPAPPRTWWSPCAWDSWCDRSQYSKNPWRWQWLLFTQYLLLCQMFLQVLFLPFIPVQVCPVRRWGSFWSCALSSYTSGKALLSCSTLFIPWWAWPPFWHQYPLCWDLWRALRWWWRKVGRWRWDSFVLVLLPWPARSEFGRWGPSCTSCWW